MGCGHKSVFACHCGERKNSMELYMVVVVAVVVFGILLQIVLNKKSGKKDNAGMIIMAASGVCANLFMLFSLHFSSFGIFIFFVTLAAAVLLVIYMVLRLPGRLKARRSNPNAATVTARMAFSRSREVNEPRGILPGAPAVESNGNKLKTNPKPRITAKPKEAAPRRLVAKETHESAVLKEGTLLDASGRFCATDEPMPEKGEDQCVFIEKQEETTARAEGSDSGRRDELCKKPTLRGGKDDAEGTAFAGGQSEEIHMEKVSPGANGQNENLKVPQPVKEEVASGSVKAKGEAKEEENDAKEAAPDDLGMQKTQIEPPDAKQAPAAESGERIRRQEILKKAALLKDKKKYLVAYHLYAACAAEADDAKTIKTAKIAMLDCLVAAGRYTDAGKQLFGILNEKYELLSEEKVKIKEYMELLHKRGRAE